MDKRKSDNQAAEIELRSMLAEDIDEVARIHAVALPNDFCSKLGRGFMVNVYYPYLMSIEERVAIVADPGGEQLAGFVTAAPSQGFYAGMVKRYLPAFVRYAFGAFLRNPFFIAYTFVVTFLLFSPRAYQPKKREMELLYEAVGPGFQGKRIGSRLAQELFVRLPSVAGYDRCVVKTLKGTPETNRFYLKNGFEPLKEAFGRVWFVRKIEQSTGANEGETT